MVSLYMLNEVPWWIMFADDTIWWD